MQDILNLAKDKNILVLQSDYNMDGRRLFIDSLGAKNVYFLNNYKKDYDVVVSVGGATYRNNARLVNNKSALRIEAGFLRSFTMDRTNSEYDQALCFFVDNQSDHYESNNPSYIEQLLNTVDVTNEQKAQAKKFINKLITNKLTKYNDQSENFTLPPGKNILIVEQSKNDQAVLLGNGHDDSFKQMLECARDENPGCNIILKIHPDTLNKRKGGLSKSYYGNVPEDKNTFKITQKVNPYTILEQVDKTYAFSSMLGIESIMSGTETHIFGMPCYAGWGLTNDRTECKRRQRVRTIEELVYIIYFMYTRYIDTDGNPSTPDDFLNHLIKLKRKYNNV
jgi:capsular polysaccharide export protein